MKKIVGIIAAVTMAASVFAVDFNARVIMEGSIADGTIDINGDKDKQGAVNFWKLNKKDQKDADALVLSANGDKAGAQFQMWYQYEGGDKAALKIRSTSLWFKPIDMLKVTIGDVDVGTYKEMIDWWKVASGETAVTHQTYTWSSYATVSGAGLSVEATPIDGLWLSAGVVATPGTNLAQIKFDDFKNETYGAYGVAAKYNLSNLLGLPMTTAISWRDEGKGSTKILAIGADYGNNFAAGLYAMMNVRLRFENLNLLDKVWGIDASDGSQWFAKNVLTAVVIDNYFKYSVGALNVQARLPVTVRGLVKDMKLKDGGKKASDYGYSPKFDQSYMSYEIKATYAFDSFNVYLDIENDNACTFTSYPNPKKEKERSLNPKETFLNMNVQSGVTFNIGTCALDVGLMIDVPNKKGANIGWSIPFTASVAF